jgi:hypothetical protein
MKTLLRALFLFCFALLLTTATAFGQNCAGSFNGIVAEAAGVAVAGAKLSL